MSIRDKLVPARKRSDLELISDAIADLHGIPQELAEQIAEWLIEGGCISPAAPFEGAGFPWSYRPTHRVPDGADIGVCAVYIAYWLWLLELDRKGASVPTPQEEYKVPHRFAELCVTRGKVNFTNALLKCSRCPDVVGSDRDEVRVFASILHRGGFVDLSRLIDISAFVELARTHAVTGIARSQWRSIVRDRFKRDITAPSLWIDIDEDALADALAPMLASASDDELGYLAKGLHDYVVGCYPKFHHESESEGAHGAVSQCVLEELNRRVLPDLRSAHPLLRKTWIEVCLARSETGWGEAQAAFRETDAALRDKVLEAAAFEVGSLRTVLVQGDQAAFRDRLPAFDVAVECLFAMGSLWGAIKPLLLLFRKLPTPGVAADLRWWVSSKKDKAPLPEPWHHIAARLVQGLHNYAMAEQNNDRDLSSLRSSFARFCLDRLKSRESGEGPLEDNPLWRLGYIQAALALQINPEGKGHHTLHYASENDPEPEVRAAAKEAYRVLRHGPSLKAGESPRRLVLLAFWYLRQAHLVSLGIDIDARSANRVREEELRRTTDLEKNQQLYRVSNLPPSGPQTGPSLA